jgi:hypothetical protein
MHIEVNEFRHAVLIQRPSEAHIQAGFFSRLTQCCHPRRFSRIDVTAGLQPDS